MQASDRNYFKKVVWFFFIFIVLILVAAWLGSCKTTKLSDTSINTSDSSLTRVRDSAALALNILNQKHATELQEARKTSVVFKDKPCPVLPVIDSTCDKDSLVKMIRQLTAYIQTLKNKVTYFADGKIEAEGDIASINSDYQKLQKTNDELSITNLSLLRSRDSLAAELKTAQTVKHTSTKRKWFTGWGFYALIALVFFVAGWVVRSRLSIASRLSKPLS